MSTVLVLDDEPMIRMLLEDLMLDEGHRVLVAADRGQALEQIALHGAPDAMIVDYNVGADVGTSIYRAMVELCGTNVPAVLLTADWTKQSEARAAGMEFLGKPARNNDIREMVENLLMVKV